jgi:hypothetical protein
VSPDRGGEAGTAMVMALLVLFLVSVSLALLAGSLQLRMRLVREDAETIILSGLSDAAVDEALAGIAQDADYTGEPAHDFGGGQIGAQIERSGSSLYKVTATATYDSRKRAVQATVVRSLGGVSILRWRRLTG